LTLRNRECDRDEGSAGDRLRESGRKSVEQSLEIFTGGVDRSGSRAYLDSTGSRLRDSKPLRVARREAHGTAPQGHDPRTILQHPTRRRFCHPRFGRLPGESPAAPARHTSRRNPVSIFRGSVPTRRSAKTSQPVGTLQGINTPESPDSTTPHSVPPSNPHIARRADRHRRARRAGVSWPHVHRETARDAQHACLMPHRALSIASIRICVPW
jgi:hypothetical protein